MSVTLENVEVNGRRGIAMYLDADYRPATKERYDLVQITFEDGGVTVAEAEVRVNYTVEAKDKKTTCAGCAHYAGDGVCMADRVQRAADVPEKDGLKLVAPGGWCEEWEKLETEEA